MSGRCCVSHVVALTLEHVFDEDAALGDVLVDGELLVVRSYEEDHCEERGKARRC